MKRLKSKLALFLAMCMLLSSVGSVFAEEAEALPEEEGTVIIDDGILFDIDYEGDYPEVEKFEGSDADLTVMRDTNGNNILTGAAKWGNNGYMMESSIPLNGGDYQVTFDFSLAAVSRGYYFINLSERATIAGDQTYNQFGLCAVNASNQFLVGGLIAEGMTWEADKWYSYSMVFNRSSRHITAEITEKDNPENKATVDGTPKKTSATYGNGIEASRVFDCVQFTTGAKFSIDNILIEEYRGRPFAMTAYSGHVGNIFSGKDKKEMKISYKNMLLEPATGDMTYEVFDEDGNKIDEGVVKGITAKARETVEKSITVKAEKYGVYSLYCYMTAKGETGEPVSYDSGRIAFSVANKLEEGEPLNPYTSVNIEWTDSFEQWTDVRELLLQAGISNIRKDMPWWRMERENHTWVVPTNAVAWQDMKDNGIGNMVIMNSGNPFYPGSNWDDMSAHLVNTEEIWKGYEDYVNHISSVYGDVIKYYEVLNEANVHMTVEQAVKYLKIAAPIIKKNDPDSIIVAGSTGGVPN